MLMFYCKIIINRTKYDFIYYEEKSKLRK